MSNRNGSRTDGNEGCAKGELVQVPIGEITVGERCRKDLGDIERLAKTMRTGQLQPIGITPEKKLIFGQRRLEAAAQLGWATIAAVVLNLKDLFNGEIVENIDRKQYTVSERVAIGLALERQFDEEVGERRGNDNPRNAPVMKGHETTSLIAKRAGFGNPTTYRCAKLVIASGRTDLIQRLDSCEISIHAAWKLSKEPQNQTSPVEDSDSELEMDGDQVAALRSEEPTKSEEDTSGKNGASRKRVHRVPLNSPSNPPVPSNDNICRIEAREEVHLKGCRYVRLDKDTYREQLQALLDGGGEVENAIDQFLVLGFKEI